MGALSQCAGQAELCINAFAHWFAPFARDGWNVFDVAVVGLSLAALAPGVHVPVNVLRSLRALRVVRLFGKVRAAAVCHRCMTFNIIYIYI